MFARNLKKKGFLSCQRRNHNFSGKNQRKQLWRTLPTLLFIVFFWPCIPHSKHLCPLKLSAPLLSRTLLVSRFKVCLFFRNEAARGTIT